MDFDLKEGEVLATVRASAPRRWLGVGTLGLLGLMLIYVAAVKPPELHWQMFLLVLGGVSMWTAYRLHQVTENWLVLTPEGVADNTGRQLARLDNITRVERGAFAFKPSNGFLIHLAQPVGRVWAPGLWWRMGRRVAIGGVLPGGQTKNMAEILSALLAQKDSC